MPGALSASSEAAAIIQGDLRAAARLITRIERGPAPPAEILRALYRAGGKSHIIGLTGPPGAGKSSLVDQLLTAFRHAGKRVAVLAFDPSSPLSGGAILGDRVRLQRHADDPGVFIRSMASRGAEGGLAQAAADALTVLDAMGWDVVIIETVGVGQNEIAVVRHAASVVLVETPASGDAVQSIKAGIAEIADIFVVNKADQAGAAARERALREMLENRAAGEGWRPPVVQTSSLTASGIPALVTTLESHARFLAGNAGAARARRLDSLRHRILSILHERAGRTLRTSQLCMSDAQADELLARSSDPYDIAARLGPSMSVEGRR